MNGLKIVFFVLLIINLIFVIYGKKTKIIPLVSLAFLILFSAGIRYSVSSFVGYDLRNYEILYNNTQLISRFEFGYKFINDVGNAIGLSFDQFHFAIILVCFLAIFYRARKLECNLNLLIVAYLLYFLIPTTGQLKNLCALAIFIQIFPICRGVNERRDKIREIVLIAIASTFHVSFLIYYLFLAANIKSINKEVLIKTIAAVTTIFSLLAILSKNVGFVSVVFNNVLSILDGTGDFYSSRYANTMTGYSSLASIAIVGLMILAIRYWRKWCVINPYDTDIEFTDSETYSGSLSKNSETISLIALLTVCYFPLVILNASFYRLIRDVSLIVILHIGINCNYKVSVNKRLVILLFTIGICIGWFIFDIVIKGYYDDFMKNYFVNFYL